MKEVKLFYLEGCPHCRRARGWMDELFAENPAYRDVPLTMIEESRERALADSYDYYYVPTFYVGGEKAHEGIASKEIVKAVFDAALA